MHLKKAGIRHALEAGSHASKAGSHASTMHGLTSLPAAGYPSIAPMPLPYKSDAGFEECGASLQGAQ